MWNFIPSLIFRSLALRYKLGNKQGENVRKLGQNMSGNCQECQEFSTLQKSGHSEDGPHSLGAGHFLGKVPTWSIFSGSAVSFAPLKYLADFYMPLKFCVIFFAPLNFHAMFYTPYLSTNSVFVPIKLPIF